MNIKVREVASVTVLDISGNVMGGPDADTFHETVKDLLGQGRRKILVNLGKVQWINSTGLGILIAGYTSTRDAGGEFKLLNISDRIESIFMVTKLAGIFDSFEEEGEALASFGDS
ncbi:MAG: STAS domain-containing protein [Candidatus Krumholzibacteria bacterium]|jgi:anti-sigma B factor antagonist|nr:STAS domain-containing protein [Candidatus Krumholzibacteria bacterium]MDP6669935.1 STAS domain-containing protein [Candidatus Krumholzibacteria bacterium]MDP6796656.1 STAS domain-containing protein [Candidatus Krumholzibacteria bacterium]MDP7021290.1 STAS domain-containing protein [Candidatus Krumholzibacteria bacterium]